MDLNKYASNLKGDFFGGLTAGIVALPLALAFAIASGVPPQYGLYTAIVAGFLASLFGGSPVQITGPTGAMTVVLIGIVAKFGYDKVLIAGVMAGIMLVGMGLARMGKLITYIPFPLTTGFTNGIAVIIFAGQIDNFLGLPTSIHSGEENFFLKVWESLSHIDEANPMAVLIASLVIAAMVIVPRYIKTIPGSLIGLIIATAIAWALVLEVKKIGEIPRTLPMPHGIDVSWGIIKELIRPAIAIAALGAIESLLSAVVADGMTLSERHDSNKELIGQGIANIAAPFFGGIPATGAIARTAVNVRNGGKTKLSGMLHAVFLLIIMFVFADLASEIPLAALAGILMMTSLRMVEVENTEAVLRSPRADIFVMLLTFFITVAFDLVLAVEVGLMAAGILFVKRMSELGMIKESIESIETVLPMPDSAMKVCPHVFVYRIDAPLFFGAADTFVGTIKKHDNIKVLILRLRRVTAMDATGAMALRSIVEHLHRIGAHLLIAGLQPQPREVLEKMGILQMIGKENLFDNTDQAILHAESLMTLIMCVECAKYQNGVCAHMICQLPSKDTKVDKL